MTFLEERLSSHDALLVHVLSAHRQHVTAKPLRVYSSRFAGPLSYTGDSLAFMGGPESWGNVPLVEGETAIVFVRYLGGSEGLYQYPWRGHLSVEEIGGIRCAVAHCDLLSGADRQPPGLYAAAFPLAPCRPNKKAFPFEPLERHMMSLVQ